MLRVALFAAAVFWSCAAGIVSAQDRPVVVEIFTSQGCSSCPPADKLVHELERSRPDVIALALHVDYWDYIGWKDPFANPAFTTRQRAYTRAAGSSTIYTPQIVVGGQDHVIGARPMELMKAVNKHANLPLPAKVALSRSGDRVTVEVTSAGPPVGASIVEILTYTPSATTNIRRGENAGRTLDYHNIVRDLTVVGDWSGAGPFRKTVRVSEGAPVVALVRRRSGGPVLGAARLR